MEETPVAWVLDLKLNIIGLQYWRQSASYRNPWVQITRKTKIEDTGLNDFSDTRRVEWMSNICSLIVFFPKFRPSWCNACPRNQTQWQRCPQDQSSSESSRYHAQFPQTSTSGQCPENSHHCSRGIFSLQRSHAYLDKPQRSSPAKATVLHTHHP